MNVCCQKPYLLTETTNARKKTMIDVNTKENAQVILLWMCHKANGEKPMTIDFRIYDNEQTCVYNVRSCTERRNAVFIYAINAETNIDKQLLYLWLPHVKLQNLTRKEIRRSMRSADTLERDKVMLNHMIEQCLSE